MMTARTWVLGGEAGRRGFFSPLNRLAVAALACAFAVATLLWLGVGGTSGVVAGFVVLGGAVAAVLPGRGRRPSPAERWLWRLRFQLRRSRGLDRFAPPGPGRRALVPAALGHVVPLDLGNTPERDLFVLHTGNPGAPGYLSVVLQVDGPPPGLRSAADQEDAAIRFGSLLSRLEAEASLIRGIQQLHRVAPVDLARHRAFLHGGPPLRTAHLAEYENLIALAAPAQQHRDYLVAKIPLSPEFLARARSHGEAAVGWARLVRAELARLAEFAAQSGLFRLRALGEQRTCAVLRSLQDPGFALDQHDGVRWSNCWQSFTSTPSHLVVNRKWLSRTAIVPPSAIAPLPLNPGWLAPLLTDVYPPVIRTLSLRIDVLPAGAAKAQAENDVAADHAVARRAPKVRDEGEALSTAERRARDLAPGSGHHGIGWSMAVSVTAPGETELHRACARLEAAAAKCGFTRLDWQDRWHDVAALLTYPLAKG